MWAHLWPIVAHYGVFGILLAGSAAVYFFVPFPIAKQAAIAVAISTGVYFFAYSAGVRDGAGSKQAEWDASNKAAIAQATRDRKDADQSIPELTEQDRVEDRARPVVGKPCRVRDEWDRDCH